MLLRNITLIICASLSVSAFALTPTTAPAYSAKNPPPNTFTSYCPQPGQLKKDMSTMTWSVKPHWKSFEKSFVLTVKKFVGAQWEGINLGQIICVYHGKSPQTFPIQVLYNTLSITPTAGSWVAKKGHYSNCVSANVLDCPFWVREKPKAVNINQEALDLKSNPVTNPYEDSEP
jgi:hypothetical protein